MTNRRRVTYTAIAAVGFLIVVAWMRQSGARGPTPVVAATPALTVSVVKPELQDWVDSVSANGTMAAWQEAVIGAETGNLRIEELLVDVGSVVERGQLVARLAHDVPAANVLKQEAAVEEARANLAQAEADMRRARLVADSGALSTQRIEQYAVAESTSRAALASAEAELRSVRIALEQTRIVAVDDGIISSRTALLGSVVSPGTELFRMVRQGRIEWQAEVDPQQLARVRIGQGARVALPGGAVIEGHVRLVGPTLSISTGRAIVYVSLPADSAAKAGTFASGAIEVAVTSALTLPESAVVLRDGRSDVYVLEEEEHTVSRRTVVTGRRYGDRVEIVSGLDAAARVVASGGAFLSDRALVNVVTAEMPIKGTP